MTSTSSPTVPASIRLSLAAAVAAQAGTNVAGEPLATREHLEIDDGPDRLTFSHSARGAEQLSLDQGIGFAAALLGILLLAPVLAVLPLAKALRPRLEQQAELDGLAFNLTGDSRLTRVAVLRLPGAK